MSRELRYQKAQGLHVLSYVRIRSASVDGLAQLPVRSPLSAQTNWRKRVSRELYQPMFTRWFIETHEFIFWTLRALGYERRRADQTTAWIMALLVLAGFWGAIELALPLPSPS
jgi:hypothetical protein